MRQALLGGAPEVDDAGLKAWRAHAQVEVAAPAARWFWAALAALPPPQRADVWRFATGKRPPRPPPGGGGGGSSSPAFSAAASAAAQADAAFAACTPRFALVPQRGGAPADALFTAATCFHQLQAPRCASRAELAQRLARSVAEGLAAADAAGGGAGSAGGDDGPLAFAAAQRAILTSVRAAVAAHGSSGSNGGGGGGGSGGGGFVERAAAAALQSTLRRQFPNAHQCGRCGFGPVDHLACADLSRHHGEQHGNAKISNACPKCQWFSAQIADWPAWDGHVRF